MKHILLFDDLKARRQQAKDLLSEIWQRLYPEQKLAFDSQDSPSSHQSSDLILNFVPQEEPSLTQSCPILIVAPCEPAALKPPFISHVPAPIAPIALCEQIHKLLSNRFVQGAGLMMCLEQRLVFCVKSQVTCALTEMETALLSALLETHPQGCSHDFLLNNIWQYSAEVQTQTVFSVFYKLNAKLRDCLYNTTRLYVKDNLFCIQEQI